MGTLSKLILIGRVGTDPECQHSQSGMNIAKFPLSTHDFTKDKTTGEKVKKTDWHKLTAFGQTADLCQKYVKKGTQLYIEGKLGYSSYDKDGQTIMNTEIIVQQIQFLSDRQSDDNGLTSERSQPSQSYQPKVSQAHTDIDMDDDIPF